MSIIPALAQPWENIHLAKCVLGADSMDFLGHKITADGVRPLSQKLSDIHDFPQLISAQKLCEFLGVINYYHRFILGAASTLRPPERHAHRPPERFAKDTCLGPSE